MKKFSEKSRNQIITKLSIHLNDCHICQFRISRESLADHLKIENSGHLGWALDELVKQGKLSKRKITNRYYWYIS